MPIDVFSTFRLDIDESSEIVREGKSYCYRGIEIVNNDINSSRIEHATQQLQYAIPNLISGLINQQASATVQDDSYSFAIFPIIVTNATLRIFKSDCTIENIKSAENENDFSTEVEYLIYRPGINLELATYIKDNIRGNGQTNSVQSFGQKMVDSHPNPNMIAGKMLSFLIARAEDIADSILIVNSNSYGKLLDSIKAADQAVILKKQFDIVPTPDGFAIKWH